MPPCVMSLKTPSDILGRGPDCQVQLRSGNSPVLLEDHCLSCNICPLILDPAGGVIIASYLLWLIALHLVQLVITGAETERESRLGREMGSHAPLPVPAPKAPMRRSPSILNRKLCQKQLVRSLKQNATKGILPLICKELLQIKKLINPVVLK